MRPLGISSYEDKLVESAISEILVEIYEPKFYDFSYGFRPNRCCHDAVCNVLGDIQQRRTNFIVEADIRSFFDTVNHEWLIKMLEHDIADKRFVGLVKGFLDAGVMEYGKYMDTETGTPQGNSASAVLSNVYLHYVLDNWFDVIVKRQCKGFSGMTRYADDFTCCFEIERICETYEDVARFAFATTIFEFISNEKIFDVSNIDVLLDITSKNSLVPYYVMLNTNSEFYFRICFEYGNLIGVFDNISIENWNSLGKRVNISEKKLKRSKSCLKNFLKLDSDVQMKIIKYFNPSRVDKKDYELISPR